MLIRSVAILVLLLAVASCSASVTKEQADLVCNNFKASAILGTHGAAFARSELQKQYHLDPPAASELLRQAVRNYCPEYQPQLGA